MKFSTIPRERKTALGIIADAVQEVSHPAEEIFLVCRDADDEHILACARHSRADFLATGGEDLLAIENYERTATIRPRDFERLFLD